MGGKQRYSRDRDIIDWSVNVLEKVEKEVFETTESLVGESV